MKVISVVLCWCLLVIELVRLFMIELSRVMVVMDSISVLGNVVNNVVRVVLKVFVMQLKKLYQSVVVQCLCGFLWVEGLVQIVVLIVVRLILWELNGVSRIEVMLVFEISGEVGIWQLLVCSMVMLGMFCEVMVMMNSGMLMLMVVVREKFGVVYFGIVSFRWNLLKFSWFSILVSSIFISSVVNIVQCGEKCLYSRQLKNIVSISRVCCLVVLQILMLMWNSILVSSVEVSEEGIWCIRCLKLLVMLYRVIRRVQMMKVLIVLLYGILGRLLISSVVLGVDQVIMIGIWQCRVRLMVVRFMLIDRVQIYEEICVLLRLVFCLVWNISISELVQLVSMVMKLVIMVVGEELVNGCR